MKTLFTYFKNAKEELRKVVWPDRKTVINHTAMVIGLSLIVAVFLGGIDYVFQYLFDALI